MNNYPIKFFPGFILETSNILHSHPMPSVQPAENLSVSALTSENPSMSWNQNLEGKKKKQLPMETCEETAFGFHDETLDSSLQTKPFKFGSD